MAVLMAVLIGILGGVSVQSLAETKVSPNPLPKTIRIEGAGPRGKIWEKLSSTEKKLVAHLYEAGRAGRVLLFVQSHRHSLAIKDLLETSLSSKSIEGTKVLLGPGGFQDYLMYAAKFLDLAGPYTGANRKYVLTRVSPEKLETLFKRHASAMSSETRREITLLLTDPAYEVQQYPENTQGTDLERTGGNLYEHGITGADVQAELDKTLKPTLNCQVVRTKKGLACPLQTIHSPGIIGKSLKAVVKALERAKPYATTEHQKAQIDYMIRYFSKGDVEDFRRANIEWVKDASQSKVDFMLGWVEVYQDWLARIGSWESYVQIVDPDVSKLAARLASHAQYFEDAMPYGSFKKKFPPNYSPPAMMVYYFQELTEG